MKLSDIEVDPVRIEQGEWVSDIPEMGELRLRVRGIGNADWRRIQSKLQDAVPRQHRVGNRIDPVEQDRIVNICLQGACLLDWDGVEGDGEPLPYSKEMAAELLTNPKYRRFRDAVLWAATVVGEAVAAKVEEQAKN